MIPDTEPFAPIANLERLVATYQEDQTALCDQFAAVSRENAVLREQNEKLQKQLASWELVKSATKELVSHFQYYSLDKRGAVLLGNAISALALVGVTFRQSSHGRTSSVADSHW